MVKVLHYLNQFFAGIGGEEAAGCKAVFLPRAIGVAAELEKNLAAYAAGVATIACGDNYFHEAEADAMETVGAAIEQFKPDIFFAGPAFNAGRYGIACAKLASWVRDNRRIPAITAMHEANPGTREIGRHVFVIQTGASTASMAATLKRVSLLLEKIIARDEAGIESLRAEYGLPLPRRFTVKTDRPDYVRAIDLVMAKIHGRPFESEIPRIGAEMYRIPNLTGDLRNATIALVTEGGLVPKGNPDRLESSRGTRYFKYSIDGRDGFEPGEFEAMHTGYDTASVDRDPDRIVPLDAMRQLERQGRFKKLHGHYFVTTGTGAMPSKMAELGEAIADELETSGVNAVLLTAT